MVCIIGKMLIIYVAMFVHTVYAQGSVELSVRDMNGRKVTQVIVGQPFNIYVTMHEIDANKAHVTIERPRTMPIHRTSVQMRSINGRASTTYVYTSRIDNKGTYPIGPALVNDGYQHYQSNQVYIEATDSKNNQHDSDDEKVMFQLTASKTEAYVGETIPFILKFYYAHDDVNPERLAQPTIQNAVQSPMQGPFTGSEKINNTIYDYVEWRWDLIFEQVGKCTIPSYTLEYNERLPKQNHFGMFSVFFNGFGNTRHISSNALECTIKAVPSHDHASGFVGSVHDFRATLDQNQTSVGKAVVLTLELIGAHHNAKIPSLLLQDIPRALKYYESKNETNSVNDTTTTRFEYIIQPLHAGEWEIPSQSFTYFDIYDHAYHTIHTNPLYLTVAQGTHTSAQSFDYSKKNEELVNNDDSIQSLHETGPWIKEKDRFHIPWVIFWFLLAFPIWCTLYMVIKYAWNKYYNHNNHVRRKLYARKYAVAALKKLQRTGSVHEIPLIFKQYFADKWQIPIYEITETYMHHKFNMMDVPSPVYEEWQVFWTRLMMYAFAQEPITQALKNKFYEDSIQWLNKLDGLL